MLFLFLSLTFIVIFTFMGKSDSGMRTFGRFLFATLLSCLFFIFVVVFGPWTQEDYRQCMDKEEYNISNTVDIYKVVKYNHTYARGNYDAPLLCVDEYQDGSRCRYGATYKKIEGKKLLFTGRIMKLRSFNAFASNSYKLEVLIDGERFWVGKYGFDEIRYGGMYKYWPKNAQEFEIKNCSIFNIRDFSIIR